MAELTTFARPYAKAAYAFAVEQNAVDAWENMLTLAAQVVVEPTMSRYLSKPALSATDRAQAIAEVCGDQLDASVTNLITQLAEHHRLAVLPQVAELFRILSAEAEQTVDVELTSAYTLDEAATQKIVAALKARLQRDVRVTSQVDESLLGGMIIRAGDTVIDGSVRGRLQRLTEQLQS